MKHYIQKKLTVIVRCFNCNYEWETKGLLHLYRCPECTMEAEGEELWILTFRLIFLLILIRNSKFKVDIYHNV